MILVLEPNTLPDSAEYKTLVGQLERLPGIQFRVHREVGSEVTLLTGVYPPKLNDPCAVSVPNE